ncbi:hypothetical protein LSM04_003220 [Trypanosoma melophagium]|uniref:uncharacterized protein n=1 Tax=Trypanosoma melophagium TaxID=715481 RepID=UPI00351A9290|nr:hypothetical protein LSM04_003220 [Trypanosoma melophagium]
MGRRPGGSQKARCANENAVRSASAIKGPGCPRTAKTLIGIRTGGSRLRRCFEAAGKDAANCSPPAVCRRPLGEERVGSRPAGRSLLSFGAADSGGGGGAELFEGQTVRCPEVSGREGAGPEYVRVPISSLGGEAVFLEYGLSEGGALKSFIAFLFRWGRPPLSGKWEFGLKAQNWRFAQQNPFPFH